MAKPLRFRFPLYGVFLLVLAIGGALGIYRWMNPPLPVEARLAQAALKEAVAGDEGFFLGVEGDLDRISVAEKEDRTPHSFQIGSSIIVSLNPPMYVFCVVVEGDYYFAFGEFETGADGRWHATGFQWFLGKTPSGLDAQPPPTMR